MGCVVVLVVCHSRRSSDLNEGELRLDHAGG